MDIPTSRLFSFCLVLVLLSSYIKHALHVFINELPKASFRDMNFWQLQCFLDFSMQPRGSISNGLYISGIPVESVKRLLAYRQTEATEILHMATQGKQGLFIQSLHLLGEVFRLGLSFINWLVYLCRCRLKPHACRSYYSTVRRIGLTTPTSYFGVRAFTLNSIHGAPVPWYFPTNVLVASHLHRSYLVNKYE